MREVGEEVGIRETARTQFLCHYGYTGGKIRHEVDVYIVYTLPTNTEIVIDSADEGGFTIKNAIWVNGEEALEKLNFEDEKKLIAQAEKQLTGGD